VMEDINPTDFKTGGCAEFVYGQIKARIRNYERQFQKIQPLKRWHDLSEQAGYTKLSEFLYRYYTSQKEDYEEQVKKMATEMELVKHAMEIDKQDSESSGIGDIPV